jgi:CxxC motif-containing protein
MEKKEMICISCPIGCHLTVTLDDNEEIHVTGNKCKRGEQYGREELLAPKRVVTATVRVDSSQVRRLPVKTDTALPKEHINDLLNELYRLTISPPVKLGDPIIENIEGTGVNLVASRSID